MPAGAVTTTACAPADAFGDAQVMRVSLEVAARAGQAAGGAPTPVRPRFVPRMSTMDQAAGVLDDGRDPGVDDDVRSCVTLPSDSVDMLTSCLRRRLLMKSAAPRDVPRVEEPAVVAVEPPSMVRHGLRDGAVALAVRGRQTVAFSILPLVMFSASVPPFGARA